jgi:uncharacterized protein YuzE
MAIGNSPTPSYNREAKARYVRFSDEPVVGTIALSLSVCIDVDATANPAGFEIPDADSNLLVSLSELSHPAAMRDLIRIEAS